MSTSSDLAVATRLATFVVCQSGLGGDGSLLWTERPTPDQEMQVGALISETYRGVVARLESSRTLLDKIAAALENRQELSGADVRALFVKAENGTTMRSTKAGAHR